MFFVYLNFFVHFVRFLKFEIRVDSSGTTETDRYCSDMDFSVLNENVTLYQKKKLKKLITK